eukprot:823597-Rhodomonas_salina.1
MGAERVRVAAGVRLGKYGGQGTRVGVDSSKSLTSGTVAAYCSGLGVVMRCCGDSSSCVKVSCDGCVGCRVRLCRNPALSFFSLASSRPYLSHHILLLTLARGPPLSNEPEH